MPLPLIVLKGLLLLKFLKYPIAAVVDSLREYRRRERIRRQTLHLVEVRGFFQNPIRALRDRRFWITCLTNSAEIVVHVASLWAFFWNLMRRLTCDCYVAWHPHHVPERILFMSVEKAPWRSVVRQTGAWLANSFRRWPGAGSEVLALRNPAGSRRWVEIRFDGGFVAVCRCGVTHRHVRIVQRPGSAHALQIRPAGLDRRTASVVRPNGEIVSSLSL